jgi:multimeric flavodoxin WrbA
MKILAVMGSARKNGNGALLTRAVCEEAIRLGAEVEYVHLYDLNFKSCGNCDTVSADPYWCDKADDLVPVMQKLIEADVLLWTAPIYMGYICGTSKTFFDRFCIFVNPDFSINRIPGKKVALIITSGAPGGAYQKVLDSLSGMFSDFFKMEVAGSILAGGFMKPEPELTPELLAQAKELAAKLA